MEKAQDERKVINLTKSLNLQDLISEDGVTFEVNFDDLEPDDEQYYYPPNESKNFLNPSCSGLIDEDVYNHGEPFEVLSTKMENLIEDGLIKKRVLRHGHGEVLPDKGLVTIHYNAYVEYNDEPFDSTYIRKKPFVFTLNTGGTLPGIDIATQSMKINEKSQFLVVPQYAYGELGCLQRVPPNSSVLFEIEVLNCVDSGATNIDLPPAEDGERNFKLIEKHVHALIAKGNNFFIKGVTKSAIVSYNRAVTVLENCKVQDYDEQEKMQLLMLRLLTNLVVSYTKLKEPRRACTMCNKIYYLCKGTSLKIPTKVYFNHGKSLILLGSYNSAEQKLKMAQRLEPQNIEVSKELLALDEKIKISRNREIALAKSMFKNNKTNSDNDNVNEEFKKCMRNYCKELLNDAESVQYDFPNSLTQKEVEFCKEEAKKHGLKIISSTFNETENYVLAKDV